MGLFKRRSLVEPAELQAVRAELEELRQRLAASDHEKRIVDHRLASLDAAASALGERTSLVESISERVDKLDQSARLAELHEQLAAVTSRLDSSSANDATAALDARLNDIAVQLAALDALTLQLNQLNTRVLHQSDLNEQIGRLQHHLASTQSLADRIDVLETKVTDATGASAPADLQPLHDRLDDLQHQLAEVRHTTPDLRPVYERLDALDTARAETPEAPGFDDVIRRIAELEASVPAVASLDEIRARLEDLAVQAAAARERGDLLDERLTGVSAELVNQLAELSGELDEVGSRQLPVADERAGATSDELDEAITALRATQIRLASEQARYEIAFREDLAALADQLRRSPRP